MTQPVHLVVKIMAFEKTEIRKSPFVFLKWLLVIETLFAFGPLIVAAILDAQAAYEDLDAARTVSYPVLLTGSILISQVLIIGTVFVSWYIPTYVIERDRIIYRRGSMYADKVIAHYEEISEEQIRQGLLAKWLDYGTIQYKLHDGSKVNVKSISNPRDSKEMIDGLIERQLPSRAGLGDVSLAELITGGENQYVEFKASLRWDYRQERVNKELYHPVMKNVTAFLNSSGGWLLIGVHDDGKVLGLEADLTGLPKANYDGFENVFNQAFNNMIGAEYRHLVTLSFPGLENKQICLIRIEPADQPVYLVEKGAESFYIRAGNASQPLSLSKATQYIQSHFNSVREHNFS